MVLLIACAWEMEWKPWFLFHKLSLDATGFIEKFNDHYRQGFCDGKM